MFASVVLSATQGLVYAYQPIPYEWLAFIDEHPSINKTTVYALLQYFIACLLTLGIAGILVGIQIKSKLIYFSAITSLGAIIIFIGARLRFVSDYTFTNVFPFGWQHSGEIVIIICVITLTIYITHKIKTTLL